MYKSVPPLQEMFNMAGMQLPNYLKGEDPIAEAAAQNEIAPTDTESNEAEASETTE